MTSQITVCFSPVGCVPGSVFPSNYPNAYHNLALKPERNEPSPNPQIGFIDTNVAQKSL